MEGLGLTPSFWGTRRVFITGHTGFKGSWLSLWLRRLGAAVTGYSLPPPTQPNLFQLARIHDGLTSIEGDVQDIDHVRAAVASSRPEIIIHMAAQSLVRQSYADPVGTYATDVMGTVHVLEAARNSETVRLVVVVTSDKCYENHEWVWGYRENDPMGGHDPYSGSKGCAELATASYRAAYCDTDSPAAAPLLIASVRAGNVIGGGDWAKDRLVPDIIQGLLDGHAIAIRNPSAVRPWQHVLDPLHGYLMLVERLAADGPRCAEAWNFGPREEDAQSVAWLADRICGLWGGGAHWQPASEDRQPHEATYLKLDCSKTRTQLRWRPVLELEAALEWTVEWYREGASQKHAREMTEAQIARFQELLAR